MSKNSRGLKWIIIHVTRASYDKSKFMMFRARRFRDQAEVVALLVNPAHGDGVPVDELLGLEPQGDLLLGRLDCVGAVDDVAADL